MVWCLIKHKDKFTFRHYYYYYYYYYYYFGMALNILADGCFTNSSLVVASGGGDHASLSPQTGEVAMSKPRVRTET
jgi:hypothetical protein